MSKIDQSNASLLLHTLVEVEPSFCSPCCTNKRLYFVLELGSYPLRKHTARDDRDHHNNRLDMHQHPASSTLPEAILIHSKHICREFRPPFLGHRLRAGASQDFPLYGVIYFYFPRHTQAKDNVAHIKAKSLNRDYYECLIILPFSLHPSAFSLVSHFFLLFERNHHARPSQKMAAPKTMPYNTFP